MLAWKRVGLIFLILRNAPGAEEPERSASAGDALRGSTWSTDGSVWFLLRFVRFLDGILISLVWFLDSILRKYVHLCWSR